jgi:hypothetical protein
MVGLVSIECAYPSAGSGTLTAPSVSLLAHQRCVSSGPTCAARRRQRCWSWIEGLTNRCESCLDVRRWRRCGSRSGWQGSVKAGRRGAGLRGEAEEGRRAEAEAAVEGEIKGRAGGWVGGAVGAWSVWQRMGMVVSWW